MFFVKKKKCYPLRHRAVFEDTYTLLYIKQHYYTSTHFV